MLPGPPRVFDSIWSPSLSSLDFRITIPLLCGMKCFVVSLVTVNKTMKKTPDFFALLDRRWTCLDGFLRRKDHIVEKRNRYQDILALHYLQLVDGTIDWKRCYENNKLHWIVQTKLVHVNVVLLNSILDAEENDIC
jgi:hypothetical protein